MGTYEELKAAIQQVIRTNGNNEITGALLQNALLSIVNVVGANATFAGIATPNTNPGTADQNVFYLATKAGTYVNFGGIEINMGEAVILSNKTGNWVKTTSGFATQQQLTELESQTFSGWVDNINNEASNYIDNIKTAGFYIHKPKSSTDSIYTLQVRVINNLTYQIRQYYSGGLLWVEQVRHEIDGGWSEWEALATKDTLPHFEESKLDDIKGFGVYQNDASPSVKTGILFVFASHLNQYSITQTLITIDTSNNAVAMQRHYDGEWTDWGVEPLTATELAKVVGKESVMFDYSEYKVSGKFIRKTTKELADSTYYSYALIPLDEFTSDVLFITTGLQGGGILPIAYWKSAEINENSFVARASLTTYNGASGAIVENYPVFLSSIPKDATHISICWSSAEYPNMTIGQYAPSVLRRFDDVINRTSWFLGQRDSVLGEDALKQYKRGVAYNIGDYDTLIFVAGQSNADGRGQKEYAPQWLIDMNYKIDDYMIWNRIDNKFQSWELGINTGAYDNKSNWFGFDIFFAKKWLEDNPGKKLYAIKQTEGGIPIGTQRDSGESRNSCWSPKIYNIPVGENSMCLQFIERIHAAFEYAKKYGIILLPHCLLWHQGEADMTDARRPYFEAQLKTLLGWFRGLFGSPSLPIINGDIADPYETTYPNDNANVVFDNINAIDSYFKTVDMTGKGTIDGVHFNADAIEYLGYKMYENYKTFLW